MQATEAYIGSEQRLAVHPEASTREMNAVIASFLPSFRRRAYRYLGNAADADDAVQDALLSAYKHLDQFKRESQMSTWLTVIVINSARMRLRSRLRQTHVSLDEPIGEHQEYSLSEQLADRRPNPEDECQSSELRARLHELATQLSPSLRKAFQLRALEGLTTSEAAHSLGVPEGTVKARLTRARAKLKRLMRSGLDPQPRARHTSTTPLISEKQG
jgi:RNA polymerase sigma factor (sigma-70 family)